VFGVLGGQYRETAKFINSLRYAFGAACLAAILAGMPSVARAVDCPKKPSAHLPEATQPLNLGEIKLQLLDYLCFGGYDRDIEKVLADARAHVEARADKVEKPALVLDIDETSLSTGRISWQMISALSGREHASWMPAKAFPTSRAALISGLRNTRPKRLIRH